MDREARGVGRIGGDGGMAVFVPWALPGERVAVKVEAVRPRFCLGSMASILRRSPDRVEPACPVYGRCGGCDALHMRSEALDDAKEGFVREALRRIAGVGSDWRGFGPIIRCGSAEGSRNKTVYPVCGAAGGGLAKGYYGRSSHSVAVNAGCPILHGAIEPLCRFMLARLSEAGLTPYDEATGKGALRKIVVRVGVNTREALVGIVLNGAGHLRRLPDGGRLLSRANGFLAGHSGLSDHEVVGFVANVNEGDTNVIFGDKDVVLDGRGYYIESLNGVRYKVSLRSFFQVNSAQAERLYQEAVGMAELGGWESVADICCGVGAVALQSARFAGKVVGVEVSSAAVADAKENAAMNGVGNVRFVRAKAEEAYAGLSGEGFDVAFIDPPRKGLDAGLIGSICERPPKRIVYISCDPATLARDVAAFRGFGYALRHVRPVDMFPGTTHVETVASLYYLG